MGNRMVAAGVMWFVAVGFVSAQPPLPGQKKTLERLPNDQVEGTIWEFRGKLTGAGQDAKNTPELTGKFRVEGSAIFDVSPTFKLPSQDEVKKVVDKVVAGKGVEVKLPAGPQQNRLGEFGKISGGKYRLDFRGKAKGDLNGIMIIWKKPGTDAVMLGTYAEREGTKTVRNWEVELRALED